MGLFSKLFGQKYDEICAPVSGQAVPVTEVPDPTFSSGMLGNGVAVIPSEGKICAPCDGTVDMMFETGHAVSMVADCGAEVLVHVGLETVGLQGKGFTVHAQNGQKVKKGDKLMHFDDAFIKANAKSDACLVIFTGLQEGQSIQMEKTGAVKALDEVAKF